MLHNDHLVRCRLDFTEILPFFSQDFDRVTLPLLRSDFLVEFFLDAFLGLTAVFLGFIKLDLILLLFIIATSFSNNEINSSRRVLWLKSSCLSLRSYR